MSLSDLHIGDDLDIAYDPDQYQDQTNPIPPLPGNYRLCVVGKIVPRKDKDGNEVKADGKFPVLTINRAKIVEPSDCEKEFAVFHDLRTKPFDRYGTIVSDIADITRSMDQTRRWGNLTEGLTLLEEMVDSNTPFTVQAKWTAYDGEFVKQEFERLNVTKDNAKLKLAKDIYEGVYKKARLTTNAFRPNGKGGRTHIAQGPSGAMLEARFTIAKFIPSLEVANLGPFTVKP